VSYVLLFNNSQLCLERKLNSDEEGTSRDRQKQGMVVAIAIAIIEIDEVKRDRHEGVE
jgi:hypothetical protein